MPAIEPFSDVVVVIPGIGGSVLARQGRELWAPRPGAALRAVLSLGSSIKDLELDGDDPTAADLGDGITATRLVPDLHVVPGLGWKIEGYGRLREQLVGRLGLTPGHLGLPAPALLPVHDNRRGPRLRRPCRRAARARHGPDRGGNRVAPQASSCGRRAPERRLRGDRRLRHPAGRRRFPGDQVIGRDRRRSAGDLEPPGRCGRAGRRHRAQGVRHAPRAAGLSGATPGPLVDPTAKATRPPAVRRAVQRIGVRQGDDGLEELCRLVTEVLKDAGERPRSRARRTVMQWWEGLLEDLTATPFALVVDDIDELSPDAPVIDALRLLVHRRGAARLGVSVSSGRSHWRPTFDPSRSASSPSRRCRGRTPGNGFGATSRCWSGEARTPCCRSSPILALNSNSGSSWQGGWRPAWARPPGTRSARSWPSWPDRRSPPRHRHPRYSTVPPPNGTRWPSRRSEGR